MVESQFIVIALPVTVNAITTLLMNGLCTINYPNSVEMLKVCRWIQTNTSMGELIWLLHNNYKDSYGLVYSIVVL